MGRQAPSSGRGLWPFLYIWEWEKKWSFYRWEGWLLWDNKQERWRVTHYLQLHLECVREGYATFNGDEKGRKVTTEPWRILILFLFLFFENILEFEGARNRSWVKRQILGTCILAGFVRHLHPTLVLLDSVLNSGFRFSWESECCIFFSKGKGDGFCTYSCFLCTVCRIYCFWERNKTEKLDLCRHEEICKQIDCYCSNSLFL